MVEIEPIKVGLRKCVKTWKKWKGKVKFGLCIFLLYEVIIEINRIKGN